MPLSKITTNSFPETLNVSNRVNFANTITSTAVAHFGTSNSSPVSDESLSIRNSASHALSLRSDMVNGQAQIIFQGNINRYQLGVGNSQMLGGVANSMYLYNNTTATFGWIMQPDGYIKTPFQPGCKINIDTGGGTLAATGPTTLTSTYATFSKTNRDCFDRMNNFNTTTGRFTAPVAGMYVIGCNWMRNASIGTGSTIRFAKNGGSSNIYARYYRPGHSWSYETSTLTTITTLAAGDYINIVNTDPYTVSFYEDDSYFFAYFLG